jgi:pyruvate,water dikinase
MLLALSATGQRIDVGAKAASLSFLQRNGFAVPQTWVVPWAVHRLYRLGRPEAKQELRRQLAEALDPSRAYAVRSSASVEDGSERSFAGQFASFLDVVGHDEVFQAVVAVWDSAHHEGLGNYLGRAGANAVLIDMAVVIQEMVAPDVSGVVFTKNPLTGLDEVILEAVAGSGVPLVQHGVQPERWVHKWGAWTTRPSETVAGDALAGRVVREARAIARAYGRPVDLEWVSQGEQLYWLQVRPITALGGQAIYSNRISREVLPGLIKPLVWSVNIPIVNSAWIRLFEELIGPSGLTPDELSRSFYYRAYFNMGSIGRVFDMLGMPRETLELLMGVEGGPERPRFKPSARVVRRLPRMAAFLAHKARYEQELERRLPALRAAFEEFASLPLAGLSEAQLLTQADRLSAICQEAAYTNIAAPVLMYAYNAALSSMLRRAGVDPALVDMDEDSPKDGQAALSAELAALNRRYQMLPASARAEILNGRPVTRLPDDPGLVEEVERFLVRFGHLSESGNDFSRIPWREQPELVWHMIATYVAPTASGANLSWSELPLSPGRRLLLGAIYRRARRFRSLRDRAGDNYTYGYGQFRPIFREIGRRLVQHGVLDATDDIFYLTWDEVRSFATGSGTEAAARALVTQRREEMQTASQYNVPEIIFGDEPPPPETISAARSSLSGMPTSRGYFRGPVRVVLAPSDFDRVEPGAAVAIPYSDVSWTPLIARAGAVISESGGMLSHSAIVAREYGLPAVLSVDGACTILRDGAIVTVDGFRGMVVIHGDESEGWTPG